MAAAFVAVGLSWGDDKKEPKGALPTHYKQLGLSDDQTAKVKKIHGEYKEKIDDLEAQVKKLREESKTKCLEVLTDEQKKKLAQLSIGEKSEDKKDEKKPEK
jgi:Spy/CpxP family protein refolding chaperone